MAYDHRNPDMQQPLEFQPIVDVITANGQNVAMQVGASGVVAVTMVAASLVGHNATFEVSIDSTNGTDGTWVAVQALRSNANTIETTTGVLAASPAYGWRVGVAGWNWFRIRATAHTSGTATYTMQRSSEGVEPVPGAQISGTQPVSGSVSLTGTLPAIVGQGAEDAAIAGNAVRTGGRVRTSHPTTFVAGDAVDVSMTTAGQQVVKIGGVTEAAFNASLALTTTTAQAIAAAAGAGLKRHLTGIQAINTGAAVVDLIILDGTTERWRLPLPINVPVLIEFDSTHLITTANAALNANLSAAGTVRVNAQGYTAP